MKKCFVLALLCINYFTLGAQSIHCGHTHAIEKMDQIYEGYKENVARTFDQAQRIGNNFEGSRDEYTVQVVFHVLYNTPEENIPDSVIFYQLEQLNKDFQRLNEDADNTRDIYKPFAGSTSINFELASIDPQGNPTTGINRVTTDKESFIEFDIFEIFQIFEDCGIDIFADTLTLEQIECLEEALGGSATDLGFDGIKFEESGGTPAWPTDQYINVWIGDFSIALAGESTPFLLGVAYPPVGAPNWPDGTIGDNIADVDGVIVHYEAVGPNNPFAGSLIELGNDLGRTLSHEMGHYFGLRHVWGDGDCTMDDGFDDTPPMGGSIQDFILDPITGLPINPASCSEIDTIDSCIDDNWPDLYENYMNYSPDRCMNMFTQQQTALMVAMLEGPRVSLLGNVSNTAHEVVQEAVFRPNPTTGYLQLLDDKLKISTIYIFNMNGQEVLKTNDHWIDLTSLSNGVYILKTTSGNREITQKVVKI